MWKKIKCWWLGHEDVIIAKERVNIICENESRYVNTLLFKCERCSRLMEHETTSYYRSLDNNLSETEDHYN